MKETTPALTVKEAIKMLQTLDPETTLITERSLSDKDGVRIVPQLSGETVLLF